MAAPAAAPQPTLTSGAADATYNENLATIEHSEGNLFGPGYGTSGEISPGSEIGKAIAGTEAGVSEAVGPNFATKGELGGSLGLSQGIRTRAESARAGANTQSGLYGTERANTLLGFNQRATGITRRGNEQIERDRNKARKDWENFQRERAGAIRKANERYLNYVQRNPMAPPGTVAAGGPPGSSVTSGPGSPGQPIKAGFKEAEERERPGTPAHPFKFGFGEVEARERAARRGRRR